MRKKRIGVWVLMGAVPLLIGVAFFSLRALSRTPAKIDPEKLARVERIDLARSVVATGQIEPTTKVEIKSKASGIILKLPVNVGDVVHTGPGDLRAGPERSAAAPAAGPGGAGDGRSATQERPGRLRAQQGGGRRSGRAVPEDGHGSGAQDVPGKLVPQTARDDAEKNYQMAREPAAAGHREPGRVAGGHRQGAGRRSSSSGRNSRSPRRICAMPPSFRPSMAWCSRATAKWATRSARF